MTTRDLGAKPGFFARQQFQSESNVDENREWFGPEIHAQLRTAQWESAPAEP